MLLSFEIPTKHIQEFGPLEDFQFGLAHLFLKPDFPGAEEYLKLYRGCLLDNSMYELGSSLSIAALLQAAEAADPVAVIAPDQIDDSTTTLIGVEQLLAARPKNATWSVGGVVQGKDYSDRKFCYVEMMKHKLSPICFPFRSPREETVPKLFRDNRLKEDQWYQLLGLRNLKELSWNPPGLWSLDTGKPFKSFLLNEEKEIRGHGTVKLHDELGIYARRVALWNIAYMRQLTRDTERTTLGAYINYRRKHVK